MLINITLTDRRLLAELTAIAGCLKVLSQQGEKLMKEFDDLTAQVDGVAVDVVALNAAVRTATDTVAQKLSDMQAAIDALKGAPGPAEVQALADRLDSQKKDIEADIAALANIVPAPPQG